MTELTWAAPKAAKSEAVAPATIQPQGSADSMDVYFVSDVNDLSILTLTQQLREKETRSTLLSAQFGIDPPAINLHITSYGGSVTAGLGASDVIRTIRVPVNTIIAGHAASSATLLSLVGTRRFIYARSHILIHQLSNIFWGKHAEFKDEIENLDLLMSSIRDLYLKHTKIPKKELPEILKHDLWWDAKKALELGLVDEIL